MANERGFGGVYCDHMACVIYLTILIVTIFVVLHDSFDCVDNGDPRTLVRCCGGLFFGVFLADVFQGLGTAFSQGKKGNEC